MPSTANREEDRETDSKSRTVIAEMKRVMIAEAMEIVAKMVLLVRNSTA